MLNIFSRFISWFKKIFHTRPEPTKEIPIEVPPRVEKSPSPKGEPVDIKLSEILQIPLEKKIEAAPIPEKGPPEIPSEKEPFEAKPPDGKTPEVPPKQEKPSIPPPKKSKGVILTVESEEEGKAKIGKPYNRKTPTEEREKKRRKPSVDEKKATGLKQRVEIDLGSIKRKKPGPTKQPQQPGEIGIERTAGVAKGKETLTRVESPYVEINLDEAKVFFIIPKQQFETNPLNNIPQQLNYKLELNGDEQTISVRVRNNKQGNATVEEMRIDLEQSLKNFKIIYPDEFQGRVYSYQHSNEILYAFIPIGNNCGRMHYLYDSHGNFNPLPNRDIWILLEEDFDLVTEPDVIEEIWIWDKYRPMFITLKNTNELVIKNRQTEEEEKIPCELSYSIEGEEVNKDDFKEQSPLFAGKSIKIKAPAINPSGWIIWIQNKQAGYKVIAEDWTGDDPLVLKLPDDLPCECGEFQIDICEQEDRIPIETLFFRYIPSFYMEFPRELIIPDSNIGHKQEIIKILLERDFQDWELKLDENVGLKHIENGYQAELLPEYDTLRLSLMKKGKPETETSFKITIPRLKWKTSKDKKWYDKPLQIKRDELIAGEDFYLTICTNDFDTKYDLSAILETDGQKLQEAKFIRRGIMYSLLLNQFYDTIKKNRDKIALKMEIRKAKNERLLNQVDVIHLPGITKGKSRGKPPKQPLSFKPLRKKDIKNVRPNVRGGRGRIRIGKGFSRPEIIKAGIDINDIRRLSIPFDKRRKSTYLENIEILKSLTGDE
ncbi:MAG: hypothetical protein KBG04_08535 [Bacteroidales bacterium]|nr:hypothetical protein [Bacteroidales bacterium]